MPLNTLAEWAESSDYSGSAPHEHVAAFRKSPHVSKRPLRGRNLKGGFFQIANIFRHLAIGPAPMMSRVPALSWKLPGSFSRSDAES